MCREEATLKPRPHHCRFTPVLSLVTRTGTDFPGLDLYYFETSLTGRSFDAAISNLPWEEERARDHRNGRCCDNEPSAAQRQVCERVCEAGLAMGIDEPPLHSAARNSDMITAKARFPQ